MYAFYTTLLTELYGKEIARKVEPRIQSLVDKYKKRIPIPSRTSLTERDSFLITYADQVQSPGSPPLSTLERFCKSYLKDVISSIHILPFFPSSSDDGFSVMDYRVVDPALGNWETVNQLGKEFRLMIDGVVNHASVQGEWFKAFLQNEEPYRDYFLTVEGMPDLTRAFRPRTTPLLTTFTTKSGPREVWTTFSADQVDLDYRNPDVLMEMLEVLLFYASQGAQFIRLDAIAYLWKHVGTACIHLPQTHYIVQLFRVVFEEAAPHVRLVTETNVSHADNMSYFGDGHNEAQLVYNFALPPLVMHTLRTGDSTRLSEWAEGITLPSNEATFFNFLASHDGIGLNPVRGILKEHEIEGLIEQTQKHGGIVSYGQDPGGGERVYELNINYFDALSDPNLEEPIDLKVNRFMAAQAILCSLRGVPAIYFHSLFGSRNWREGVRLTGQNRAINRQKLDCQQLEAEFTDEGSLCAKVFQKYRSMLRQRATSPAFDPYGDQKILDFGKHIFTVLRTSPSCGKKTLCLHNVTAQMQSFEEFILKPYHVKWLINQDIPKKYSSN